MKAELLSPAGDFETALAAFDAGADAVYCGLSDFSARAFAKNFSLDELSRLVAYARALPRPRRVYVTFNTLIDEAAFGTAAETLAALEDVGPDALIVQDLGVARLCRRRFPGLALHASTQLVAHNLEGVLALRDLGFVRVVLARELSFEAVADIARRSGVELECFIHGALCYSVSGLCLFSAMEKGRSGNRGRCAYCCRQALGSEDGRAYPFSMKDLRLGDAARRLSDAGVASLKIEGRMKTPLYVASVTRYYRERLDGARPTVSPADLETVFSRRTTPLYFDGPPAESPVDPVSLGPLGARIGAVKRVTRDREGRAWLRFRTLRALERHDGLQFEAPGGGKPIGFGVGDLRTALSRAPVFEVAAGTDVEVALPETDADAFAALRPGADVYCSMSNAVRRAFPAPSWRPDAVPGADALDVDVSLAPDALTVAGRWRGVPFSVSRPGPFAPARSPEKTREAVEKAFGRLGGTGYRLGTLTVSDPDGLYVPAAALNDARRALVAKAGETRAEKRRAAADAARADRPEGPGTPPRARRRVKIRQDQTVPPGAWDEVVVALSPGTRPDGAPFGPPDERLRLALPVFTDEAAFPRLRSQVKAFVRRGYAKWEASDLATLRLLRQTGVADVTADWTLYAFNRHALAALAELGVSRVTASPENDAGNLAFLAGSGFDVEFLSSQATPLFISLTPPGAPVSSALRVFRRDGLWVTTRARERAFDVPPGASSRLDLSWSPS